MQRSSNNFHKIYTGITQENKAKNVVLTFYNFPEIIYAIDNISDRAYVNTLKP